MNLPFDAKICAELTARAVIQQTRLTLPPLTTTTLNHSFTFLPSAKKHEDGKNYIAQEEHHEIRIVTHITVIFLGFTRHNITI